MTEVERQKVYKRYEMSKTNLYLFIGPKGTGKSSIIDHLKKEKSEENLFVPSTIVAAPVDMMQHFQENSHYLTMRHREFRERAATDTFKFLWREFNDKQYEYVVEEVAKSKKEQENHNMIYKGFNNLEIEGALAARRDIILNLSNAFLFKTRENMYVDNFKKEKFNLLRFVIESLKDICRIKIIFVRSPQKQIAARLEATKIYNSDEIESIVSHGVFMQGQTTLELCIPEDVTVSYIDNNSTIEEAAKRAWLAMTSSHMRDEVKTYFNNKHESEHYNSKYNIQELLEYLLNSVVLHRPDDPIDFLIETLEKLSQHTQENLMTVEDVETMFDLIDINSKKSVTTEQLVECMENLQIPQDYIERVKSNNSRRNIEKEEFTDLVLRGLNPLNDTHWS